MIRYKAAGPTTDPCLSFECTAVERESLADVPNAIAFQKVLETDRAGYLIRQYFFCSLYDRIRYGDRGQELNSPVTLDCAFPSPLTFFRRTPVMDLVHDHS